MWRIHLHKGRRRAQAGVHVFLATGERCPCPFLVKGAFNCDLSRQSIRCTDDRLNDNGHLVRRVAEVFRDRVIPFARQQHLHTARILALLNKSAVRDETGEPCRPDTTLSRTLRAATIDALHAVPFLPTGGPEFCKVSTVSTLPSFPGDPDLGVDLRRSLCLAATAHGRALPIADLCPHLPARTWAVEDGIVKSGEV